MFLYITQKIHINFMGCRNIIKNYKMIGLTFCFIQIFSRIHSWKERRRLPRPPTSSRLQVSASQPLSRQNSRNAPSHQRQKISRNNSHHSPLVKSYSSPAPNSPNSSISGSCRYIHTGQGNQIKSNIADSKLCLNHRVRYFLSNC